MRAQVASASRLTVRRGRVCAGAVAAAFLLLTGCTAQSDAAADVRCEQVKEAADSQAAAAAAAIEQATRAAGDTERAEAAYLSAAHEAGFPGTPELNAATDAALLARNAAQEVAAEADRGADRQRRLAMQIVVGDPACFEPAAVAEAREHLDAR
jgi:hypothetical protein